MHPGFQGGPPPPRPPGPGTMPYQPAGSGPADQFNRLTLGGPGTPGLPAQNGQLAGSNGQIPGPFGRGPSGSGGGPMSGPAGSGGFAPSVNYSVGAPGFPGAAPPPMPLPQISPPSQGPAGVPLGGATRPPALYSTGGGPMAGGLMMQPPPLHPGMMPLPPPPGSGYSSGQQQIYQQQNGAAPLQPPPLPGSSAGRGPSFSGGMVMGMGPGQNPGPIGGAPPMMNGPPRGPSMNGPGPGGGYMGGPPPMGSMQSGPPPMGGLLPGPPPPPLGAYQNQGMGARPGSGLQAGGGSQGARIDPTQMPRPVAQPTEPEVFMTRLGGQHAKPPPAAAHYVVRDCGSCSPRYIRSTLNEVPFSNELLNTSGMPLALVVSPLALPDPGDEPIAIVDTAEQGPVRCSRCKAYMNPWVRWPGNGRSFTCNMCNAQNQVPESYYCHIGPDGRRRDTDDRPELCKGTVEYLAPPEYIFRAIQPPIHVFLIDVTAPAVAAGITASVCRAIGSALEVVQGGDRALVAIGTYDSTVHFYTLRGATASPQMLVVSDLVDVYAPASSQLLLPVAEHRSALKELLESIPNMFASSTITDSVAGVAIEAAMDLLAATGGKIHAFLGGLPTLGVHALKPRDGGPANPSDKDKPAYLSSQDNTLKSLACTAADHMICIDLSFLSQSYADIASLSDLASTTGGSVYQYSPYNVAVDFDQLVNDLRWNVSRLQGLEAVMRVRCSNGLDVDSYVGHLYKPANTPDVYLPAVDCDKAVLVRLSLLERLSSGSECYVQSALLYTNTAGRRVIRVQTLALPITDNISAVFKGADQDAQICSLSRRLAASLPGQPLPASREGVTSVTVNILQAYRKHCAQQTSAVQLILPESLKLLPLYALALLKSPGLKDGVRPDDRSLWLCHMLSLPCGRTTPLLYPRLLAVHRLLAEGGTTVNTLPAGELLSSEVLEPGGVYFMENGQDAYLYLDKAVAPELLQELLGVASYDELLRLPAALPLPTLDTRGSALLRQLLVTARLQRSSFMRLRIARKGDPAEVAFFASLVEDRSTAGLSYVEYLCQVHKLIQNRLT